MALSHDYVTMIISVMDHASVFRALTDIYSKINEFFGNFHSR